VVVISGVEEQTNKRRAREAGAHDFIAKSADAAEVLARLDNVLRLVSTRKELEAARQVRDVSAARDRLPGDTGEYLVTETAALSLRGATAATSR